MQSFDALPTGSRVFLTREFASSIEAGGGYAPSFNSRAVESPSFEDCAGGVFFDRDIASDCGYAKARISCVPHILSSYSVLSLSALTDADYSEFSVIRHTGARGRSLAARAVLRRLLTAASGGAVAPSAWRFARSASGKPHLQHGDAELHFSCSHSQVASIVAVSTSGPVGIDIANCAAGFDDALLANYYSKRERAQIAALPEAAKADARVRLWTLKEAHLKRAGGAVSETVRDLEFELDADCMSCSCADVAFKTWPLVFCDCRLSAAIAMSVH